jgi:hypothetical protein
MKDYYELLGLSPQASKAEIKAAFLQQCKEYHPDKLPPGTPEKARRLVEEHFKKINEAYQILSEPNTPTPEPPQYRGIFNPHTMSSVSERLEHQRHEIQLEYKRHLDDIEQTIHRRLAALGLHEKDLKAITLQGKISFILFYSVLALFSLSILQIISAIINQAWVNRTPFLSLILALVFLVALVGLFGAGFMAIKSCLIPIVSQRVFNQAQQIKKEMQQALTNAKLKYEKNHSTWQQHLRAQIDFYKTVPIYTLTCDYVTTLDAEHQFFLLQALRERSDFGQLEASLRDVAQITISMGIMNMLFGSTTVVKS